MRKHFKKHKWTVEDDNVIRQYYPTMGIKCVQYLSDKTLSKNKICGRARKLKVKCNLTIVNTGKVLSEETKKKISIGLINSEKHKKLIGVPLTTETKEKIALANKGRHYSSETEFTSEKLKQKWTESEYREKQIDNLNKMRNSPERRKGQSDFMKQRWVDPIFREEMSRRRSGENNPRWQGGISKDPYPFEWQDDLKEAIRKRDHHVCQNCGLTQEEYNNGKDQQFSFPVHHIDYDKNNLNPTNLITLCPHCHSKTNVNRNYWTGYFNALMSEIPASIEIIEKP